MEILKKTIQRIMTTGTTTGCTGSCRVIIPDLTKSYYIKFCLNQDSEDIGFFDAYTIDTPYNYINLVTEDDIQTFESVLTGGTSLASSGLQILHSNGIINGTTVNVPVSIVTGSSSSRLTELKKYVVTSNFNLQYVSGGTQYHDGVDYSNSTINKVVYYLGGIKYVDVIVVDLILGYGELE